MAGWSGWMQAVAAGGTLPVLLALVLTLGAYLVGVAAQRKTGNALANPVLIAIALLGTGLRVLHIRYASYFAAAQFLHFLLGPATVALAIPLVRAITHIRRSLWPMLAALVAGSVTGAVSGYALVRMCGGSQVLALTMLPKSVTTPIALEVAHSVGGVPSLTAVLAILSGVMVAVGINHATSWIRVIAPAAVGRAAGTAGSGIGASRVIEQHPLSAAFAAVAIGLNGLITAALAPLLAHMLKHW